MSIFFDGIAEITGCVESDGDITPHFKQSEAGDEMDLALKKLKPRDQETAKKISKAIIEALLKRFVKMATAAVKSAALTPMAAADFEALAAQYMPDLLSGNESRINSAIGALKNSLRSLLIIYNNHSKDQEMASFYSITVEEDNWSFTEAVFIFFAYIYLKRNKEKYKKMHTLTMEQKINDAFDYSNGDFWQSREDQYVAKKTNKNMKKIVII